jgi:hypothetical protein
VRPCPTGRRRPHSLAETNHDAARNLLVARRRGAGRQPACDRASGEAGGSVELTNKGARLAPGARCPIRLIACVTWTVRLITGSPWSVRLRYEAGKIFAAARAGALGPFMLKCFVCKNFCLESYDYADGLFTGSLTVR